MGAGSAHLHHPADDPADDPADGPGAGRRGPRVDVTVSWATLAGLDDQPGWLTGYGPIGAEVARELAADGTWRRLLTDPATGTVTDVGTTRYSPPAQLAELVRARDGTCRWYGCRLPRRAATSTTPSRSPADPPRKPTSTTCAEATTGSRPTPPGASTNTPTVS